MGDLLLPTSELYRLAKWSGQVSYASGVYDLQQTRLLFSRSSCNIWKRVQTKCDQRMGMATQQAAGEDGRLWWTREGDGKPFRQRWPHVAKRQTPKSTRVLQMTRMIQLVSFGRLVSKERTETSLSRMKGGKLWLFFFPPVSFINVSWMGKVSREEASSARAVRGVWPGFACLCFDPQRGKAAQRASPLDHLPHLLLVCEHKRSLPAEK